MMQAILLQRDGQRLGLVLAIHHLVVDGVSWRILLEELRQVADSAMQGRPITLEGDDGLISISARDASLTGGKLTIGRGRMYVDGLMAENAGLPPAGFDPRCARSSPGSS